MGGLQASQANFDAAMITGKPENNSPSPILNNDKHKLSGTKIFLDHQSSKDEEMSSIKNDITAFLMPIDYFVYHRRQGVAALRSL